jgi:integrase
MKLTAKTTVAAKLPAGKTDLIHFDDALPGFGYRLRLGSGNEVRRSWVVQYRRAGATRRLLLGSAEVLNADRARTAAKEILAKVALGEDPQADKIARRAQDEHTLRAVAENYLAAKAKVVRPNTYRELERFLTGPHFKPLHSMAIDQITRRDVAARVAKITTESGSPCAANARAALSALYAWALGHGLVEINPVVGTIAPERAQSRERVLIDAEIVAIWRASGDDDIGRIIKLLILTAQRRSEIGGMRWSEIDMDSSMWTLPAARAKNHRAHTLPLPAMALDIIATVPRMVSRDQLFGERAASGFTRWSEAKGDLDSRLADTVQPWTLHDLRRSAATKMGDIGVQPHIVEQVLNHASGHKRGVAGIYNKSPYANEVSAALALWADHVRALVEGSERKIVPLQRQVS